MKLTIDAVSEAVRSAAPIITLYLSAAAWSCYKQGYQSMRSMKQLLEAGNSSYVDQWMSHRVIPADIGNPHDNNTGI